MRVAARTLVGEHDFASFCRHPGAGRSTVRDLQRLSVARAGDRFELRFRANAFLHQMVRALVGTLVAVGDGRLEPAAVEEHPAPAGPGGHAAGRAAARTHAGARRLSRRSLAVRPHQAVIVKRTNLDTASALRGSPNPARISKDRPMIDPSS